MTSSGPLKVINDDEEIDMPLNLLEKDLYRIAVIIKKQITVITFDASLKIKDSFMNVE